ncbi:MAG: beta-lactamase family protein [Flavobacteriaceae bacterium]|nr:MAG: beta-lactamase family protein [Flavobacteriaceae bacterium]
MKQILIAISFFVTLTGLSQTKSIKNSPPLTEASSETVGMSEERLSFIDDAVMESIEKKEIPGAVALVARKGKIVYYKAFGMADNEAGRSLKKDDIFRIASQTKAITSTAVMMLWEEGKFRLDDPISKYIPEFKDPMVLDSLIEKDSSFVATKADKEITIRHLITHTSGIGYGFIDGDERFKKIYTKAGIIDGFTTQNISIGENIRKLAKLPLHHNPGEKFTYSEGIDVLGYFIEIVSGMPLDEFFKTRIFEPLDMDDTWFYLPKSKHKRLVALQTLKEGQWEKYPASDVYDPDYPITGAKAFFSGGAGLSSTAKDYATFLQMYLNKGELNGIRLLSRTTVQFMMANQIGDLWGDSGTFHGLAFGVNGQKGQDKGGEGSIGSFWWGGYFNTMYWADPEEEVIGILMKQTMDVKEDNTGWKFRQVVGQAIDD